MSKESDALKKAREPKPMPEAEILPIDEASEPLETKQPAPPPSAEEVLSTAAAEQVTGMILKETGELSKKMDDVLEALRNKPPEQVYMKQSQVHLEEARSPRQRPTLIVLPDEYMEKGYYYRFVNKLKVFKRKAQGYSHVMHKDCPIHTKTADGHVEYGDTVLMRIPMTKMEATEQSNRLDSAARVGGLKEGFHKAVEHAKIPGVSSFETDHAGKEVF